MFFSELSNILDGLSLPGSRRPPAADAGVSGGTVDSRRVLPGMLFCAIRGARTDGNRFIDSAIANGAAAILTDSPDAAVPSPVPVLRVRPGCGYQAVARVAEALSGHPARSLRLIGITGTCGKTTTAYLLRDILRGAGLRTGMIGTVVYDDGECEMPADRTTPTPFELQDILVRMVRNGVQFAVMEVSSAALDQERTGTAKFDAAAFTNFSRDHLDYHGTMEAYFECKCRLFTRFLKPGAPAIINQDDEHGRRLLAQLPGAIGFSLKSHGCSWPTPLPGIFNAYNAQCAGMTARALGVDDASIAAALAHAAGAPGRLERVPCGNGVTAFVDYAHTPEEIANALSALRPLCAGRLGIVFGCGGDRDRGKRPQMGAAASAADCVWVTSDNPRTEEPGAIIAEILPAIPPEKLRAAEADRRKAIHDAVAAMRPGDFLLVAGKGHEDYQEVNGRHLHFSDREILQES